MSSGGGHFSGRLTAPLCIAGGVALQILARRGVQIGAHICASVADVRDEALDPVAPDMAQLAALAAKHAPRHRRHEAGETMRAAIMAAKAAGDSVGGVIECAATGVPAGLGDPHVRRHGKPHCRASLFAIPAVKGVEFGAGFGAAAAARQRKQRPLHCLRSGAGRAPLTNRARRHSAAASPRACRVVFRAAVKPTPSIALPQRTVDLTEMKETEIDDQGSPRSLHRAPRRSLRGGGRWPLRCWMRGSKKITR